METLELTLLFDYYGDLLTERQKQCFDLRYNQDLSLAEIAQELGVSRQGVHDNLNRAEALLRNMEAKTGCVSRDLKCRKAAAGIADLAEKLAGHSELFVKETAQKILMVVSSLEE